MCKIFVMTKIQDSKLALKVAKFAEKAISDTQTHGCGYAAIDNEGNMSSEKWRHNDMAWYGFSENYPFYNSTGKRNRGNWKNLILHGRIATGQKCIENTHPFTNDTQDVYLIHNGHVRSDSHKTLKTTCDSEIILNAYLDSKVIDDIENTQKLADSIIGWYAVAVMSKKYIDIFKEKRAQLYYIQTPNLGYVFCTDDKILENIVHTFKLDCEHEGKNFVYEVPEHKLFRFNTSTGEVIQCKEFKENYGHVPANEGLGFVYGNSSFDNRWTNWRSEKAARKAQNKAKREEAITTNEERMKRVEALILEQESVEQIRKNYNEGYVYNAYEFLD